MTAAPRTNLFIRGIRILPAHVTGLDGQHAFHSVIHRFKTPETSTGQRRNLLVVLHAFLLVVDVDVDVTVLSPQRHGTVTRALMLETVEINPDFPGHIP